MSLLRSTSNGFDRLAPHYFWLESLLAGRTLQRCRTAFLHCARSARSALILGEGNGRFLRELLKANRDAVVVCVDSSAAMLALAKRRIGGLAAERVHFVHGDVLTEALWAPLLGPFDLVVTHFFLDCFRAEQLQSLIGRIAERASADAAWLLADFRIPETGLKRTRAQIILWLAYGFFRLVTALPATSLTAPDVSLKRFGFELADRRLYEAGLLHSDIWRRQSITSAC